MLDRIRHTYNTVSLKLLMWVSIVLKALDGATTYYGINNGLVYEVNPIAIWMFKNGDLFPSLLMFFNLFVVIVYHLYYMRKRAALVFVTLLMSFVVINNLIAILRNL